MATKAITVRVDETIKTQAEEMLDDIGINMTTYIVSSLKALVREKKVPFNLVSTQLLSELQQEQAKKVTLARAKKAMQSMQNQSEMNGVSEMTMDEINAEIAAYRSEKRGSNA